jgi:hypothetical protein
VIILRDCADPVRQTVLSWDVFEKVYRRVRVEAEA